MCISEDLPEIELVSLVSESLPQYKLRADTVTDFTLYRHQDWGIKSPPLVTAQELQLSNEQITEVLKYFGKLEMWYDVERCSYVMYHAVWNIPTRMFYIDPIVSKF